MQFLKDPELGVDAAILRVIADRLPAMLAYWDANGCCRFANRAYELWFGVKHESMVGRDIATFLGPLYALNRPHIEAALRGEEQVFEREIPDPRGGPPRQSQAHYIPDDVDGVIRGFCVLVVDISQRKAEEALRRMERELQSVDRLAAMTTLASGIAHEINNPLATALANLDLVLEADTTDLASRALIGDARTAILRISQTVQSMRLLARGEVSRHEQVDINDTLEQSIRITADVLRDRARLKLDLHDVGAIQGSSSQLTQVFVNLLVNAAHALRDPSSGRDEVSVRTRADGDHVIVEIADTGRGIPAEVQARIFEPFFTTKGVGMGLGLSVSAGIVQGLGGTIAVDSQVGIGSTFRIVLPSATQTKPRAVRVSKAAPPQPPAPPPTTTRLRVLLVDDDVQLANALARTLRKDHDVAVVYDGREAIEVLAVGAPAFDVVVCDLMMPDSTGVDVYAELARRHPVLAGRFILITGGAFTVAGREFLASAQVAVLEKPFEIDQLRALIADTAART